MRTWQGRASSTAPAHVMTPHVIHARSVHSMSANSCKEAFFVDPLMTSGPLSVQQHTLLPVRQAIPKSENDSKALEHWPPEHSLAHLSVELIGQKGPLPMTVPAEAPRLAQCAWHESAEPFAARV